ncbi:hypothetical protein Taro_027751 [Colocasia esculenta]|uniref:Uncharacterized protein n=1 Tax=Colocasia esculenta TaxID=4460 RepID=A0A843VEN5_COLES|nr:hypothetical protein [Colocasia esculenta]
MFNSMRDILPRSWIWVPEHRRYSHPLRFIPTPSAKELSITFLMGIRIAYKTTIRNRHSETVDKALVSRNSIPGPKSPPELATPSITRIAGGAHTRSRPVTAIGSRVQLDARSPPQRLPRLCESLAEPTRGAAQSQRSEVVFNSTQDLLPRSWIWVPKHRRYSHPLRFIPTPSAKELGITFHTGIRIAYVTTIRNRHFETVDKALVSRNSVPQPKSPPSVCTSTPTAVPSGRTQIFIRTGVRIARETPIQNRHFDPVAKEFGITFHTGIRIAYVTTIRNRHSETVDKALVSKNFVPWPKFPPERVY